VPTQFERTCSPIEYPPRAMLMVRSTMTCSARGGNAPDYVIGLSKYFGASDLLARIYDGRFFLDFSRIRQNN
jgi:hypothetical protein